MTKLLFLLLWVLLLASNAFADNNDDKPPKRVRPIFPKKIAEIPTGATQIIAINDTNNKIYVPQYDEGTVKVINGFTSQEIKSIPSGNSLPQPRGCNILGGTCTDNGSFPYGIGVNKKTNKVYVGNVYQSSITVIYGKTDHAIKNIAIGSSGPQPAGCNVLLGACASLGPVPYMITVDEKNNKIFVTSLSNIDLPGSPNSPDVSVIDGKSDTVIGTVQAGNGANEEGIGAAINHKTNKLYIANYFDATVSVIDTKTGHLDTNIHVETGPHGVGINKKTNTVYVSSFPGVVSVIDGDRNTVLKELVVGSGKMQPDGCYDDLGHGDFNDCTTQGSQPYAIAVNEEANKVYVSLFNDGALAVIDGRTNSEIKDIPTGFFPYDVVADNGTDLIYVINSRDGTVWVVNGKSDSVIESIPVSANPSLNFIYLNEKAHKAYVPGDKILSVIDGDFYEPKKHMAGK
jgi:YVTN family beta-propeller protein